jgi:hypothetical protein
VCMEGHHQAYSNRPDAVDPGQNIDASCAMFKAFQ